MPGTMLDGADDWTADLFELNARAARAPRGVWNKNGSLIDYSNRQWAGLTGDYYYRRWKTYVDNRLNKLEHGTDFTDPDWFDYGWQWANPQKATRTGMVSRPKPRMMSTRKRSARSSSTSIRSPRWTTSPTVAPRSNARTWRWDMT